eukprot:284818487_1
MTEIVEKPSNCMAKNAVKLANLPSITKPIKSLLQLRLQNLLGSLYPRGSKNLEPSPSLSSLPPQLPLPLPVLLPNQSTRFLLRLLMILLNLPSLRKRSWRSTSWLRQRSNLTIVWLNTCANRLEGAKFSLYWNAIAADCGDYIMVCHLEASFIALAHCCACSLYLFLPRQQTKDSSCGGIGGFAGACLGVCPGTGAGSTFFFFSLLRLATLTGCQMEAGSCKSNAQVEKGGKTSASTFGSTAACACSFSSPSIAFKPSVISAARDITPPDSDEITVYLRASPHWVRKQTPQYFVNLSKSKTNLDEAEKEAPAMGGTVCLCHM